MKLNYNILWIDDTPKWVESIEPSLKEHFDELGCCILRFKSFTWFSIVPAEMPT